MSEFRKSKNNTGENSDGGCESKIIFEDHANATLAQIQGSHGGSSDDTKGVACTNKDPSTLRGSASTFTFNWVIM